MLVLVDHMCQFVVCHDCIYADVRSAVVAVLAS